MAGELGNIGTAFVTVEMDFKKAMEDAKRAGQTLPPVEVRVEVDQSQATREIRTSLDSAATSAGPIEPRVEVDQSQATGAIRRALASASAAAGGIPVRVDSRSIDALGRQVRTGLTRSFALAGSAARAAFLPGLVGVAVIGQQFRQGQQDANTFSEAMKSVESAVRSAGKSTGLTARLIAQTASSLEASTSVTEESILAAVGQMTRFGAVTRKNLPQASQLLLDVAASTRQISSTGEVSASVAAKLTRALKDPTKAATVFSKQGLTLTKTQKDLVAQLVETGQTAKAQQFVFDALSKATSGAAAAFGSSTSGELRKARDSFEDSRRDLVLRILPAIAPAVKGMAQQISTALTANAGAITAFVKGIITAASAVFNFIATNKTFHAFLGAIGSVLSGVKKGLSGFAASFQKAFNKKNSKGAKSFAESVRQLGDFIGSVAAKLLPMLGTALGVVAGFMARHTTIFKALVAVFVIAGGLFSSIASAVSFLGGTIKFLGRVALFALRSVLLPALEAVAAAFVAVFGAPVALAIAVVAALGIAFVVLWKKSETFRSVVQASLRGIAATARAVFALFRAVAIRAFDVVRASLAGFVGAVRGFLAAIRGAFNLLLAGIRLWRDGVRVIVAAAVALFRSLWTGIKSILASISGALARFVTRVRNIFDGVSLFSAGQAIMDGFLDGLKAGFEKVKDFIGTIAGWIRDHKGPVSADFKLLQPAGSAIMRGFEKSLRERWSSVQGWVSRIGGFFKGAFSGEDLNITNILLGKGSVDDLSKQLSTGLNIPAGLLSSGPLGFLHPTSGWADTLAQVKLLEGAFGVGMTSGLRQFDTVPGPGVSQHVLGQAADFGNSRASDASLTKLAGFASNLLGSVFKQVIWQNRLWSKGAPTDSVIGGHLDHVHLGWQARKSGGGVRSGERYAWNERGAEMFVPHGNGYVMNAGRTKELVSALKTLAQRGPSSDNRQSVINVHSNTADPRAIGSIVHSNLGVVFSKA